MHDNTIMNATIGGTSGETVFYSTISSFEWSIRGNPEKNPSQNS
jgi:hypothetical protein